MSSLCLAPDMDRKVPVGKSLCAGIPGRDPSSFEEKQRAAEGRTVLLQLPLATVAVKAESWRVGRFLWKTWMSECRGAGLGDAESLSSPAWKCCYERGGLGCF